MGQTQTIEPIAPAVVLDHVTDQQLARFADLIYDRSGILVPSHKKTLLSNRLRRRLRDTGIANFDDYYRHLNRLKPDDSEWDAFLQEITTHETYLFRDKVQWDWFRDDFLVQCASDAMAGRRQRSLRIWSTACSTGDEPTTVACCIADRLPNFRQWNIRILGTDIGVGALEQAKRGIFSERAVRLVDKSCRRRCFTKTEGNQPWRSKPVLRGMLSFKQHNLMDPPSEKMFDLVLLKNVLIYFDARSKQTVVDNVCSAIRPGGLLLAGATEGISGLIGNFEVLKPWLHRKSRG